MAQPAYLWALVAVSIPVAIHLLSRKEGRVIPVGSLRHLHETASQQFRGIKLNELLLLALRMWLLLLLVLLLAGFNWQHRGQKWVVYDPVLRDHPEAQAFADSLQEKGYEWHWLAPGLPQKDQSPAHVQNYWPVIYELHTKGLREVTVVSASLLDNFTGLRQPVSATITWQTFELPAQEFDAFAIQQRDVNILRRGTSDFKQTRFETDTVTSLPTVVRTEGPIRIAVHHDSAFKSEAELVMASLQAIQKTLPLQWVETDMADADWIVWLSDQTAPDTQANLITIDTTPGNIIDPVAPAKWVIHALTLESALRENFTVQLAALLTHRIAEQTPTINDRRSMPDFLPTSSKTLGTIRESSINWQLLILFIFSLVAERIVAFLRKQ